MFQSLDTRERCPASHAAPHAHVLLQNVELNLTQSLHCLYVLVYDRSPDDHDTVLTQRLLFLILLDFSHRAHAGVCAVVLLQKLHIISFMVR